MIVLAHDTGPAPPGEQLLLLAATIGTLALVACYARGTVVIHRHRRAWRAQRRHLLAGWAGVAIATAAVLPPVERLLEERFSTHMTQHMVLIMVAAPLLAWGAPGRAVWAGLPRVVRTPVARLLHRRPVPALRTVLLMPAVGWCVHVATLWLWHFPAPYDAALHSGLVHALEHALFLGTAWWFWWHVVTPSPLRLAAPFAALYVAAAMLPSAALGAVLTFAAEPLYPAQAHAAHEAGSAVLADQQLAGLIMWVPADVVYLTVAVALFLSWISRGSGPVVAGPERGPATVTQRRAEEVRR